VHGNSYQQRMESRLLCRLFCTIISSGMSAILIADSGATKCEWCLLSNGKKKKIVTHGVNPYYIPAEAITALFEKELLPKLKQVKIEAIYFYGAGLSATANVKMLTRVLRSLFPSAAIEVNHDLLAAARALCGKEKGISCILGTGSNSGFYNGKKIVKNNPGLGFILGDEGSGAYLGKKVVQYFMYNTFDEELMGRFRETFQTSESEILHQVYRGSFPSRYLASFALFLGNNRGHYMIENIIEDGLNDFIVNHIYKYRESWTHPIHFTGSIAFAFKDVLKELLGSYELEMGQVLKEPMSGLIRFHS
jgi:glucosamine kinase